MSDIEKLTDAEKLFFHRRRLGKTQAQMAKKYKVSLKTYGRWELGNLPSPVDIKLQVRQLAAHERCVLYRKRTKKTQKEVAKETGFCRYYINQMEIGAAPCDQLLWHWEQ